MNVGYTPFFKFILESAQRVAKRLDPTKKFRRRPAHCHGHKGQKAAETTRRRAKNIVASESRRVNRELAS
jgi:hypothetical protein